MVNNLKKLIHKYKLKPLKSKAFQWFLRLLILGRAYILS